MTTGEFQEFVRERAEWFRGDHRESEASLRKVEEELGVPLPRSLRWLVSEYGYSLCSGVTNVPASGDLTRVVREQFGVPSRFVVLEDWDDGGLLVVDTGEETSPGEYPVYAWIEVGDLEQGQHPPDSARFVSFGAYVEYQLPAVQKRLQS